ncbi:hypothetical protein EDD85DRAFT_943404 [Armillaria nabsnona]|nr:hypothetical protein EDD85DRAFT_943404 [Armillaria nabsnona]
MAKPTDLQELAKVKAQDLYNAAASVIDDLLDNFPNPTWDSMRTDTWLIDVVSHWLTCEENWSHAGIVSKEWYKLEYSVLVWVPDLPMDLVTFAHTEFNELLDYNLDVMPLPVRQAQAKRSKATVSPSHLHQDAVVTHSRVTTPAPLPPASKPTPPMPATPKRVPPAMPKPSTLNSRLSNEQVAQPPVNNVTGAPPQTILKAVKPTPGSGDVFFPPDPILLLHQKPGKNFRVGPPIHATGSAAPTQSSLPRVLTVDVAACSSVVPGPNPATEGSVTQFPSACGSLFFLGTDDEEDPVQEDLVGEERVQDITGTNGEDNNTGGPDDEEDSPPPTKKARRLQKEPRISFIFDNTTGDLIDPYPTIFLSRLVVAPSQSPDLQHSARLNTSQVNHDAAYLQTVQGSKPDMKGRKKDPKSKNKASEVAVPRKCARDADESSQIVDKPMVKKLMSKERKEDEVAIVHATPVVQKHGPGPSKPPPVTLGISGGGFGEKVPSTAKAFKNGIKSIGVLQVDADFGEFMEVDKSYWSKAVAPFVGEQYTTACDHCRRLGMQCRKLLMHTVKCVQCHYSKLPCKVDGVAALNPVKHYRPKGYDAINTFEAAVNAIDANNTAIAAITQQFLAGLNVIAHTDSIRAQAFHLHSCLASVKEDEDDNGDEDEEYEVPNAVAEGVAGPSKKRKHK